VAFSDPQKIIGLIGLKHGEHVADLGSGSGFYSLFAAKAVGPQGRIYAIDVQKDLLGKLKSELQRQHATNVDVIEGDVERVGGTALKAGSVTTAIAANLLFQIEDKENFVLEVKRILGPGGRIVVVDWSDSFGGIGPAKEAIYPLDKAIQLFEKAGFADAEILLAGDHHYGFVMRKKQ